MTETTVGIRGISPFTGAAQGRKRFADRSGERSLAKHAEARDNGNDTPQPPALDPGRLIDITV